MRAITTILGTAVFLIFASTPSYADKTSDFANWLIWLLLPVGAAGAVAVGGTHAIKRIKGPDVYPVWWATNRKWADGEFTAARSKDLQFGISTVNIPVSHKLGSIGSSTFVRAWQRLRTGADDKLSVRDFWRHPGKDGFFDLMRQELTENGSHILLYIHGFGNTFTDAIIRAAQIGFDLKVNGVTTAFCWPSQGKKSKNAYSADEDSVKYSEHQLGKYLTLLHEKFPEHTINILAHSMGNRALLGVLENIYKYPSLAEAQFGQIFLAAPDIDADYFKLVAKVYAVSSMRTTMYVCSRDIALRYSGGIHLNNRTGYTPPLTIVDGIDTVDVSDLSLDAFGHGYYAEAFGLIVDMNYLLRFNAPPSNRPSLSLNQTEGGSSYWAFRNYVA